MPIPVLLWGAGGAKKSRISLPNVDCKSSFIFFYIPKIKHWKGNGILLQAMNKKNKLTYEFPTLGFYFMLHFGLKMDVKMLDQQSKVVRTGSSLESETPLIQFCRIQPWNALDGFLNWTSNAELCSWSPGILGKVAEFDAIAAGNIWVFPKERRGEHRISFPGFSVLSQADLGAQGWRWRTSLFLSQSTLNVKSWNCRIME